MANYKRNKPRRQVKCTLCTSHRFGNSRHSGKAKVVAASKAASHEVREYVA